MHGIPEESRASKKLGHLQESWITEDKLNKIRLLNEFAHQRKQTLAQMSISWLLQKPQMTSVLIGASKVEQIEDCVKAVSSSAFSEDELAKIDSILLQ